MMGAKIRRLVWVMVGLTSTSAHQSIQPLRLVAELDAAPQPPMTPPHTDSRHHTESVTNGRPWEAAAAAAAAEGAADVPSPAESALASNTLLQPLRRLALELNLNNFADDGAGPKHSHIDPVEVAGTVGVVGVGLAGAAWALFAVISTGRAGSAAAEDAAASYGSNAPDVRLSRLTRATRKDIMDV